MQKVLFVATVDQHIRHFHFPFLEWFKKRGYEVHVASYGDEDLLHVDKKHNVSFNKSPFSAGNIRAYKQLKELIDTNDYKLVHCHTPIAGAITRLASMRARKKGTKVIYTAHGFHFFKGSPRKNWLIYYPIEKLMSRFTDILITINEEDYNLSIKRNFKANEIKLVHGVGVNLNKFQAQTEYRKRQTREEYGFQENDFILFYAAELNFNKHQDLLIEVVKILKEKIPHIKLLLVGSGTLENEYKEHVKELRLDPYIEFLGYRRDVQNLLMTADVAPASSRREGLPIHVIEAMATGLPLVVTNVRGHRSLIIDNENGFVNEVNDSIGFSKSIEKLYKNEELRNCFGKRNIELAEKYDLENILRKMAEIYMKALEQD